MNIYNNRHSQFELFPATTAGNQELQRTPGLLKDLTLSSENTIVLCIIFIMSWVLFFSFGVERGKGLTKVNFQDPQKAPEKLTTQVPAVAPVVKTSPVNSNVAVTPQLQRTVPAGTVAPANARKPEVKQILSEIFTIQVASFKLEENAVKEADKIKRLGYETYVVPKGSHSIVCVGKFGVKEEAENFSKRIRNKYQDTVIRRL